MSTAFHKLFRIGAPGQVPDDPRPLLRWGLGIVVVFIFGGLLWMGLAPIEGAVVGEGTVKVVTDRVAIQHAKGGIVSALQVKDGDQVATGQTLASLTEPSRLAAYESLRFLHDSETARNARLRSEQLLADAVAYPPAILARKGEAGIALVIRQENKVFENRRGTLRAAEAAMRKEMQSIVREQGTLSTRARTQEESARLAAEQLALNEDLAAKGFVSRSRILDLKRARAAEEASAGELAADHLKAEQRQAELELRLAELKNRFFETVAQELKASDERLYQLQQQLAAQEADVRRDTVAAPVAGTVINLRTLAPGSAVGPLQTMMEIVPSADSVYIEAGVAPRDIRYVKQGGRAEIQVAGWNRRTMPLLVGHVEYIAADAVRVKEDQLAFAVRVRVTGTEGGGEPEPLRPGMQAMVYLRTPARTLLDYLLEPVVDSMRSAFREAY